MNTETKERIKPLHGIFIIRVGKTVDDKTESGIYKDISFDTHRKMVIKGEVIAFSDIGSPNIMFQIDKGFPRIGDRDIREGEAEYVRNSMVKHDVEEGDHIYFHYLTLEDPHNFIKIDGSSKIYKVQLQDIFCRVRDGKIKMLNDYVLGEEHWGEGWEPVEVDGKMIAGKTNSFGLVTETKDKPLENVCNICHIENGIDPYNRRSEISPGNIVQLKPNSEFENTIEGKNYWVFTHRDIIAKRVKADVPYKAVGNYVVIEIDEKSYHGNVYVDKDYLPFPESGVIRSVGRTISEELSVGMRVQFKKGSQEYILDKKYIIIQDTYILAVLLP